MNYLQKMIDKAVQASRTIEADELRRIQRRMDAAERTLTGMGYYWDGGEYFRPPKPDRLVPIQAIVSDDEKAILIPK